MNISWTGARNLRRRPLLCAVTAVCAASVVAPNPSAAQVSGDSGATSLDLKASFTRQLDRDRTRFATVSGASLAGRSASFPATGGDVGTIAVISHAGALALTRREKGRKRNIRIAKPRMVLSASRNFISAKVGGRSMTFANLRGVPEGAYDPTTGQVALEGAAARMTIDARRAIKSRLRGKLPPRELGSISSDAQGDPVEQPNAEAPALVRPDAAVDVTGAELTWRLRETFINYVHSATGGGTSAIAPATPGPEEMVGGAQQPRVYEYDFNQASGWASPQTDPAADGGLTFQGGVNFRKPDFGIDLDSTAPELHLDGEESMLVALLNGRDGNADQQNRRAVAVDFDLDAVEPTVSPGVGQTTYEWENVPATVPEGNDTWPLASYYSVGDQWGQVSFSYTVEDTLP